MQPSAHRIPESADGKQGNQGDDDNPTDRENDSGPRQGKWTAKIAVNKQFDAHAENGGFRKNIERCGDDGNGQFPYAQRKEFGQYGCQGHNRHGQFPEPSGGTGQISNHIQITAYGNPI